MPRGEKKTRGPKRSYVLRSEHKVSSTSESVSISISVTTTVASTAIASAATATSAAIVSATTGADTQGCVTKRFSEFQCSLAKFQSIYDVFRLFLQQLHKFQAFL